MFSQALQSLQGQFPYFDRILEYNVSYKVQSLIVVIVAWVSWYLWRFNISPALHPREPKQLPYWIPCKSMLNPKARMRDLILPCSRWYAMIEAFSATLEGVD